MKYLITSNCQSGGIAACLKYMLPDGEFVVYGFPNLKNTVAVEKLKHDISTSDVWVTSHLLEKLEYIHNSKTILIPEIKFEAFHPDICYALNKRNNNFTNFHYNSKLIAFFYINNLDKKILINDFNEKLFIALNYNNYYSKSYELLKKTFTNSSFSIDEFDLFWSSIKDDIFMHTINHPKINVIFSIAKLIAKRLFPEINFNSFSYLKVEDTLNYVKWPIYDGLKFNVRESFVNKNWIIHDKVFNSFIDFLNFSLNMYKLDNIGPNDLHAGIDAFTLQKLKELYL
jgi:hypothetical protein